MAQEAGLKGVFVHSVIYWLGVVLSKLASFLLIPVFTRYLSPSDYGTLELLTTTSGLLALVLGLRLTSAVFRYYHVVSAPEDKLRVISSALILGAGVCTVFGVVLYFTAPMFADLLLEGAHQAHLFRLVFLSMLLGLLQELALVYLRIQEKSFFYITINFARVVSILSTNIVLVAYFHLGVFGAVLGNATVSALFAPLIFFFVLRKTGVGLDKDLCTKLIHYSAPLVPAALAMFVIHFSDRYVLRHFSGMEQVGVYAIAYKFGMLISGMIGHPFGLIWGNRLHKFYWQSNRDVLYNKTLSGLSFVLVGAALGMSLFIREILMIMTPPEYWSAGALVPVIASAYVLFILNFFANGPLHTEAKTGTIAIINMAAAAVCLALNLLLVPTMGAMGAAVATVLTFAVMLGWTQLSALRVSTLRLEYDRVWKPVVVGLGLAVAGRYIEVGNVWANIGLKTLLLMAYPVLLAAIGFLRPSEWEMLRATIRARMPLFGRA